MTLKQYVGRAVVWYYKRADRAMRNTFGEPLAVDVLEREPYASSVPEETERRLGSPMVALLTIFALFLLTALIITDVVVSAVERGEQ
ncbi:hypothetical protein [Halobacterium hubeiense]|uniref:hypothetical protein n=1 Tax=Halobacterium hubeiense TaxID=1407499 RepID=UPI003C762982